MVSLRVATPGRTLFSPIGFALEFSLDHSRTQGFRKSYRILFSGFSFCPGGILGLFFRDGFVIGLSRVFRFPCIPLGISVETSVLEIACLDLGLGLIIGDFQEWFGYEGR